MQRIDERELARSGADMVACQVRRGSSFALEARQIFEVSNRPHQTIESSGHPFRCLMSEDVVGKEVSLVRGDRLCIYQHGDLKSPGQFSSRSSRTLSSTYSLQSRSNSFTHLYEGKIHLEFARGLSSQNFVVYDRARARAANRQRFGSSPTIPRRANCHALGNFRVYSFLLISCLEWSFVWS